MQTRLPEELTETTLGACCACGLERGDVRTVVTLDRKNLHPGRGWGCVVCELPCDGALAVLCDQCVESKAEIRFACRGYPASDGRIPLSDLPLTAHAHDEARHQAVEPAYAAPLLDDDGRLEPGTFVELIRAPLSSSQGPLTGLPVLLCPYCTGDGYAAVCTVWRGLEIASEQTAFGAELVCHGFSPHGRHLLELLDMGGTRRFAKFVRYLSEQQVDRDDEEVLDDEWPTRGWVCRQCGCTDEDCSGCVQRTGKPCSWAEENLCTACAPAPAEAQAHR